MSRVALISGAAGFLGSHLVDLLLEQGWTVVGFDDLSSGSLDNIAHLKDDDRFRFFEHDVRQPITETGIACFDAVLNLACPASPPLYQSDPLGTMDICYLGTRNMLDVAARHGAVFLQASTSEVYGDPTIPVQHESYLGNVNPIGIRACYDEGKRIAETLTFEYRRLKDVDTKVVRIFNTYGPRMNPDDGRVVSNFVSQALRGEPLTMYGDGYQTRSFCYVSDLVAAIAATLDTPKDFSGPVNIGNPIEFTMIGLADIVLEAAGSDSRKVWRPLPQDDPKQRRPDISLATKTLGWTPTVDLRTGVARLVEAYRELGIGSEEPEQGIRRTA